MKRQDFIEYFGGTRLGLSEASIAEVLSECSAKVQEWIDLIHNSFLSEKHRDRYLEVVKNRWNRLQIPIHV